MKATTRILAKRVCEPSTALYAAMVLCYAASPALLGVAMYAISRHCTSRGEILVGTLAAVAASLSLSTAGLVLSVLAELRRR